MKMKKKVWSLLFGTAMAVAAAGCGKAESPAPQESSQSASVQQEAGSAGTEAEEPLEEVVLKIYGVGNEGGTYTDEILNAINEITKAEINATIDLNMVSWGDYSTKLPAIMASGEAYDLIYTSSWCFFKTEGPKGAFYELTPEMLQSYMPETYAEYPQAAWEQASINGTVYMVPCVFNEFDSSALVIRGDLRKKYGVPEIESIEDLEAYMQAILENEEGMVPYKGSATDNFSTIFSMYPQDLIPSGGVIRSGVVAPWDNPSGLAAAYTQTETKEFYEMMHDWYSKGYIANDILASKTASLDNFKMGTSAMAATNLSNGTSVRKDIAATNPDWELEYVDFEGDSLVQRVAYNGSGMAVGRNSGHPERALMFLNLVYQNQELYDLINYGIEGKTYILNEDGSYSTPEGASAADLELPQLWMGLRNAKFQRLSADEWDVIAEKLKAYADRGYDNELANVNYDLTEIQGEIAAVNNLYDQYELPMKWGVVDPAEEYDKLLEQYEQAGIDKIIEVITAQAQEQLQ